MSDLARLSKGAHPWHPTATAEVVEVYNEYDRPLLGVFQQDGAYFLFDCVWGHVESLSVWIYTHLTDSDFAMLNACAEAEWEMAKSNLQRTSKATVALAVDGAGIIEWGVANELPRDFESVLDDLVQRYREYIRRLEESKSDADELLAAREGLVAAR